MKKTVENVAATIVVVAILVGLAYVIWGIGQLWELYGLLSAQTRLVVLTAGSVVIIGALIIAGGVRAAVRTLNTGRLNDRRLASYRECIAQYAILLEQGKDQAAGSHPAWGSVSALMGELTLIASKGVLDAHQKLAAALWNDAGHGDELKDLLRDLINAMRQDLGHRESAEVLSIPWTQLSADRDLPGNEHRETDIKSDASFDDAATSKQQH